MRKIILHKASIGGVASTAYRKPPECISLTMDIIMEVGKAPVRNIGARCIGTSTKQARLHHC